MRATQCQFVIQDSVILMHSIHNCYLLCEGKKKAIVGYCLREVESNGM